MKLKSLLTTLAAAVGLTTAAVADLNLTWSAKVADGVSTASATYTNLGSGWETIYDQSQACFAFKVDFADADKASAQIFKGTGGANTITIGTDADGKIYLTVNNGSATTTVTTDDPVITGACSHVFEMLIRRGFSSSNQDKCVRLYMDGAVLLEQVSSTDKFGGGPMTTAAFGDSNKSGNLYTAYISKRVAAVASVDDDDTTMANLIADAEQLDGLDYLWGTAGSASKGIATKADGKFGLNSMTFNFSVDGNVINTGVSKEMSTGYVRVKSVKLMNRCDATKIPTSLTLKQGDIEITAEPTAGTGMSVYDTNGSKINLNSKGTDFGYSLFTFTDDVLFDPAQDITFTVSGTDTEHNGFSVMQPKTAGFGSGDWTPVVDIAAVNRLVLGTTYTATVADDTDFDKITWDPTLPAELSKNDTLAITATDTPTITFTAAYTTEAKLTINGAAKIAAADSFYDDDIIVHKTLATFGKITADNVTSADPKSGFTGGVVKTTTQFILHEQAYDIISINFANGQSVSGTGYTGLAPVQGNTWMNMTTTWGSGGKTVDLGTIKATADGAATKDVSGATGSCYAANTYGWNSATDVFLKGYLDDGGNHAQLTVNNVPYSKYDVIVYCATDTASKQFRAVTVNDVTYTYDSEDPDTAKAGSANWGASQTKTAVYGTNAIRIRNLTSSTLAIVGGSNGDGARGGIAAVQILETSRVVSTHFTATISGDDALSTVTWTPAKTREFLDVDTITITNTAENATFTLDQDVTAAKFSVVSATGTGVTLAKGNDVTLTIPTFDLTEAAGAATFDFDFGTAALKSGTDTTLNQIGTGSVTIDSGKKLTVTASGLTRSQLTNNGTLNFKGGTEADPIVYTFTGSSDSGKCTLEADTYVKMVVDGNKKYTITGAGANKSFVKITKDGDGTGMATYASFNNVTLVSGVNASGKYLWVERGGTVNSTVDLVSTGTGIYLDSDYTVNTIAGSGTLVNKALTLAPTHDADYSGASSIGLTVGGTAVQTLSGNYTGALTVNAGATVKLAGSANPKSITVNGTMYFSCAADKTYANTITGAGNIIVNNDGETGALAFTGDLSGFTGTITYKSGSYNLGTIRAASAIPSYIVLESGVTFKATQTRAEYAQGVASEFTGFTAGQKITITKIDGTSEELTVDAEGKAASTASGATLIDGAATLFDVTFTNKEDASQIAYKAVSATLQYDTTATFYDPQTTVKDIGVYIKHHPYINGVHSTFNALGDFTAVFVGTMSPTANRIFVHFGSSLNSNKGILIATMADTDKVGVFSNAGGTLTELKDLSVPNSASARHVYIVTKKTDSNGDTIFTIYLDGVKRAETKQEGSFVLGSSSHCGVQVGADFGGGIRTGTYKAVENVDGETGVLNVCRIYDYLLSDAQVTAITTEYPYISEGGLFTRNVEGAEDYSSASAWTKSGEETPAYDVPTGTGEFSPSAKLTATGDGATITVNTNSTIDTFTFNGSAMSFVKDTDGTNKITVATAVINAPVTIRYNALNLSAAAISLSGTGALTFDFQDFDLASYFEDAKIQITGMVDQNDTNITAINIPTAGGRKATFAYDDGEYYLTVTVTPAPFVYTIDATEEEGTWTWNGVVVTKETVDAYPSFEIWKQGAGSWTNVVINRTYVVKEGTLVAGDAKEKTGTVTVDADATFDFNGKADGFITINLNGGSLVNNGGEMGTGSRQLNGIALTAASTIGGTGNFGLVSGGWGANTLDLGGTTLTKTGDNFFWLCHTTVTNGTLNVTAGTIKPTSSEVTFTSDAALVLTQGTTLDNATTLTIGAITASEATINNTGTISGFTLTGTATLTGNGTWGTITNAADAVATIGTKRGLTFAGAGTVNVTLTDAEYATTTAQTLFTVADGTVKVGTVTYNGADVTDDCEISGGAITVKTARPFIYNEGWTWNGTEVTAEAVAANTALDVVIKSGTLEWPMDRATIKVEGGTLKATSVPTSTTTVTVESGATFDLNGQVVTSDDKVLNVTLNGGTLANSGEKAFLRSLTLTAPSTMATGTGKIGLQSRDGGWAATTLTLGENTLTKTGTGTFSIVMATISGTGLIDITDGEFYISEEQNFGSCPVKLSATSTLFIRGGKTMTVGSITAAKGAVINNDGGTLSEFTLTGAVALVNKGTFGVITLADSATIDIGQKRGLTINEAGTVKATITDAEKATDSVTVFTSTSDTKPTTITLVDEQGEEITGFPADYDDDGNYVVQFSTSFTIADVDNATKTVEGATLVEGNTYKATLGTEVTVTYTANDGYHFGDGTPSVTVKATAAKDIEIKTSATTTKYPVKIGSTYYLTLAAALDAAEDEAAIDLCDNVTFAPNGAYTINKTIYLTLNKFNLTGNGGKTFEVVNNGLLSFDADGSMVTGVRVNVGKATNDNGTLWINGGIWTIDNNTLVHVNGTCNNCSVYIQGATMTSNGDNAIQLCGAGSFEINGGTITGATAVYAKAGELSVAAALVANGEKKDYKYNENGANATGDAIVIDNCGYPEGPAAVQLLTGTTLTSTNADKMGYYVYNGSTEGTVTKGEGVEVNTPAGYLWKNGKLCKKVGTIIFAK